MAETLGRLQHECPRFSQPQISTARIAAHALLPPTDADVDEAPEGGGPLHRLVHIPSQRDAAATGHRLESKQVPLCSTAVQTLGQQLPVTDTHTPPSSPAPTWAW